MMEIAVAALGAAGLVLALSGSPWIRSRRFTARVEPYLGGLTGRPSGLVGPRLARSSVATRVHGLLAGFGLGNDDIIADRLEAADLPRDVASFRLEQFVWGSTAMVGTILVMMSLGFSGSPVDARVLPVAATISFVTGFFARDWWLTRQVVVRRSRLEEELPSAIDLVTLSIMAGESVPAAFARAAAILPRGVGSEFSRVVADVRAGMPMVDALEGFARRVDLPSFTRFVEALITGIERGSPLAEVLRAQADDGRDARRRHLLEMGGRREVLMLVPVVFLIMPIVIVFALFPGLVSLDLLVP